MIHFSYGVRAPDMTDGTPFVPNNDQPLPQVKKESRSLSFSDTVQCNYCTVITDIEREPEER